MFSVYISKCGKDRPASGRSARSPSLFIADSERVGLVVCLTYMISESP